MHFPHRIALESHPIPFSKGMETESLFFHWNIWHIIGLTVSIEKHCGKSTLFLKTAKGKVGSWMHWGLTLSPRNLSGNIEKRYRSRIYNCSSSPATPPCNGDNWEHLRQDRQANMICWSDRIETHFHFSTRGKHSTHNFVWNCQRRRWYKQPSH